VQSGNSDHVIVECTNKQFKEKFRGKKENIIRNINNDMKKKNRYE
jgi:hypothetical protein